jgi:hypothetical protein
VTEGVAANGTENAGKGKGKGNEGKGKGKGKNNGNNGKGKGKNNGNNGIEDLLQQAEAALQAGGQEQKQGGAGGLLESLGLGNLLGGGAGGLLGGGAANAGKGKNNAGEVGAGAADAKAGQAAGGIDLAALGIGRNKKRTATSFRA